ncbi:MAG: glycosyltransferase [Gemmataceae bacterium]
MRVAFLSASARAGDAIGNQLAEKVSFFLNHGADVAVFVEDDRSMHPVVRPHYRSLSVPCMNSLRFSRGSARIDSEQAEEFLTAADLIIVEYSQYFRLLEWLPLLAGRTRVLFDYHSVTPPEMWFGSGREALEQGARQRGLAWFADMVLTHSQFARQELLDACDIPMARLQALGYPINTNWFHPGPPERDPRRRLGLENGRLLLYVGRVAPNKRLAVLIEALARLRCHEPPIHALIIGDTRDVYQDEMCRCQRLAKEHGVADRLHFLGHVEDTYLRDAYRAADVFIMPSRHEGFCLPVLEAMACGVPVVAARAAALPETVADAGLTFMPDDANDLARQIIRVLKPALAGARPHATPWRVAVVACRYGADFVGGAETSLRTIARFLRQAGHEVSVFTTCTRSASTWGNHYPAGESYEDGILVRRFTLDGYNAAEHNRALQIIRHANGKVTDAEETDYLRHSLHSRQLIQALGQETGNLDAIIVGPYLFGLTYDVARRFPEQTLLLPCIHDEPFARLRLLRAAYEQVGGILYHSPAEQAFAEIELGLNHPRSTCIGTWLDTETIGDAERGRQHVGGVPYLLYAGRYCAEKDLPLLLEYAERYAAENRGGFLFAFMGEGEWRLPRRPWLHDLGFLPEDAKRDVLAGAAALLQLSRHEALSLVALEAWAQGTPVIAHAECAVLAEHTRVSGGGQTVNDYASFAAALDDLKEQPTAWSERGQLGRSYVRREFGSASKFQDRLERVLRELAHPLAEAMRQRGPRRAAEHGRLAWRAGFAEIVEQVLDATPAPMSLDAEVTPRQDELEVGVGPGAILIPVQVHNRGSQPLVAEGPCRYVLRCRVIDDSGHAIDSLTETTPLPDMVLPGQTLAASLRLPLPPRAGTYSAALDVVPAEMTSVNHRISPMPVTQVRLLARMETEAFAMGGCLALVRRARALLAEAQRWQRLPDDYLDVTEGWFASWKRWLKHKLLGNFRRAYVDVLSRQQSAFNRQLLSVLTELVECGATLDHALAVEREAVQANNRSAAMAELARQLEESQRRNAQLENRLHALESRLARLERYGAASDETTTAWSRHLPVGEEMLS